MDADRWRRAAEVFEAALDRPEADTRAYVQEACGGDADLRREVEALIEADRRASALDVPLSPEAIADLSSVKSVGPYRLDSLIGIGGMGEVYRARDPRLGREVAIKLLPAAFAADRERLARFAREAQVLASLNHPNIAAIYGIEADGGVNALVLELVEGPTLADRLTGGSLQVAEALAIARQIADALAAAHEAGVVHRDLKPANVKVRDDGTVKVLDFGLAKIVERDPASAASPTASPTITTPAPFDFRSGRPEQSRGAMTAAGIILGTAAYMSPEQSKGKAADHRSDVWAFGCVLYEMLTGRRAFQGDDLSDTLAAILRAEPDWNALGNDMPETVQRVVRRCLQKDPGSRYHAIADARLDLADPTVAVPTPAVAPRGPARERLAWALFATTLVGGLVYLATRPSPPPPSEIRFQLAPPEKGFFGAVTGITAGMSGATVSPDTTRVAYVATDASERTSLWVRPLDSSGSRSLAGTDNASLPFWSPDGRSIGFFADGELKSIDVATGAVRVLADNIGPGRGASWGSRDVIVFSYGNPLQQLARVSAEGGPITVLPTGNETGRVGLLHWPHFLPDGRHFIYWSRLASDGGAGLVIGSIDPGFTARPLVRSDTAGVVLRPGILLFARGETLLQQPFDSSRLQVSGEATRVNEQILFNPAVGLVDFTVSAAGALAYQSQTTALQQFAWVDRAGRPLHTVGQPGRYRAAALSPDGKRLAYEDIGRGDIWILDLDRQTSSRFTSTPGYEACPVWFPDGTKIAYRLQTGGIYEKDVSGTTAERQLLDVFVNGPQQVTADGKWILYFFVPPGGQSQDIAVLPLTGGGAPRTIVASPFADVEPYISPDGRWLAYASTESGGYEVYVQPFPPTGERWQISSAGGRQPMWRADGKELFFVADDRRFYAVDITATPERFDYGVPRFLFDMRANVFNVRNSYMPSADGQRFLVNMLIDRTGEPLDVVLNWKPR